MIHEIELKGCTPTPLAHYLKALGILRLVAEQKDPNAKGCWRDEAFVLHSNLDKEGLVQFFLEEYQPTPITAPWNGGSGFYFEEGKTGAIDPDTGKPLKTGKKLKTGIRDKETEATRTLDKLLQSQCDRLKGYRDLLKKTRQVLDEKGLDEAPKENQKALLIQIIRNTYPDKFLKWLDAVLLIGSDKVSYPPLLGTGGNDGRLDFTNNYMQRLLQLFDVLTGKPNSFVINWLEDSLFLQPTPRMLRDAAIGQFLPGNAGSPNGTAGFESKSLINPWDFILMLEGGLFFATNTVKRLNSDSAGALSFPFTVRMTGAGSGAGNQKDEANSRNEIWLPVWNKATSFDEVCCLFQEGRVTVDRRFAKDGLDFARAISAFGFDRGINEFQRYGFVKRNGDAYLATPVNRIAIRNNPATELINELERNRFLDNLRRFGRSDKAPGRMAALAHQLEGRLFDLTRGTDRRNCQDILILLGKIQRSISLSHKAKEEIRQPIPLLTRQWLLASDDGSHEFRLAAALASLKIGRSFNDDTVKSENSVDTVNTIAKSLPMRFHFAGLKTDKKWDAWDNESRLAVWGEGSLTHNLVETLRCRWLAAQRLQHQDKPFAFGAGANLADIAAFLGGSVDDQRISDLVQGLALINDFHSGIQSSVQKQTTLPAAYSLLKPFFVPDQVLVKMGFIPQDSKLPLRGELLSWLAADQPQKAVDFTWAKLHQAGIGLPHFPQRAPHVIGMEGPRLLAALAFPIAFGQLKDLLLALNPSEQHSQNPTELAQ